MGRIWLLLPGARAEPKNSEGNQAFGARKLCRKGDRGHSCRRAWQLRVCWSSHRLPPSLAQRRHATHRLPCSGDHCRSNRAAASSSRGRGRNRRNVGIAGPCVPPERVCRRRPWLCRCESGLGVRPRSATDQGRGAVTATDGWPVHADGPGSADRQGGAQAPPSHRGVGEPLLTESSCTCWDRR
jgi:hypothetical protein